MGDIADMMLEGLLDEESGEYIGDVNEEIYGVEAPGFPISYERGRQAENRSVSHPLKSHLKVACPVCGKKTKVTGLVQHCLDVHGEV